MRPTLSSYAAEKNYAMKTALQPSPTAHTLTRPAISCCIMIYRSYGDHAEVLIYCTDHDEIHSIMLFYADLDPTM